MTTKKIRKQLNKEYKEARKSYAAALKNANRTFRRKDAEATLEAHKAIVAAFSYMREIENKMNFIDEWA